MKIIIFISLLLLGVLANQAVDQIPISPDDPTAENKGVDEYIQREIDESKRMYDELLNFKHAQDFGFILPPAKPQDFVFAVDVDEDMEAVMTAYTEVDGSFVYINKTQGQEITVEVYENRSRLIGTWRFYHTRSMLFHAKKQNEYIMRVSTGGSNKLCVLNVEHFIYKGSTAQAAKKDSAKTHQAQMQGLKQKLVSFMRLAQNNQVINQLIAQNVVLHMNRYMGYQILEGLIIFIFALAQAYFIRRLLSKGYSIV